MMVRKVKSNEHERTERTKLLKSITNILCKFGAVLSIARHHPEVAASHRLYIGEQAPRNHLHPLNEIFKKGEHM